MTPNHRITLDVARLDAEYEKMMDELYLLHHTYPTNLKHINLTEADLAEYGEYSAMARGLGEQQVNNPAAMKFLPTGARIVTNSDGSRVIRLFRDGVELKKKTIYPRDYGYQNGLPVGTVAATRSGVDAGCIMGMLLVVAVWVGFLIWVLR